MISRAESSRLPTDKTGISRFNFGVPTSRPMETDLFHALLESLTSNSARSGWAKCALANILKLNYENINTTALHESRMPGLVRLDFRSAKPCASPKRIAALSHAANRRPMGNSILPIDDVRFIRRHCLVHSLRCDCGRIIAKKLSLKQWSAHSVCRFWRYLAPRSTKHGCLVNQQAGRPAPRTFHSLLQYFSR